MSPAAQPDASESGAERADGGRGFLYRTIQGPSAVHDAVAAYFLSPGESSHAYPDLIVRKGNQLQVYSVRVASRGELSSATMHHVTSWTLWGVVKSMIALPKSAEGRRDAILLVFEDAKVAVVSWCPTSHSLHTISLHDFQAEPAGEGGLQRHHASTRAFRDPDGRCVGVLTHRGYLAVLPSRVVQQQSASAIADRADEEDEQPYAVDLRRLGMHRVRDVVLLHRSADPIAVVLHEHQPTADALMELRKDSCTITAVSLGVGTGRQTVLWRQPGLPSDAWKLEACPKGGVLVFCQYAILHYSQGQQLHGIVVSPLVKPGRPAPQVGVGPPEIRYLAAITLAREMANELPTAARSEALARCTDMTALAADLWGAAVDWMNDRSLAILMRDGRLLCLTLDRYGSLMQDAMIKPGPRLGPASAVVCVPGVKGRSTGLCFAGSHCHDSVLMSYTEWGVEEEEAEETAEERSAKRQKMEEKKPTGGQPEPVEADPILALLYGPDPNDAAGLADRKDIGTGDYVFQVLDSLPCVSPIRDAALGDATALSGEEGDQSKAGKAHGKELVCCAGHGDTGGSISVLQQSLELDALVSLDVPGATGVWAVNVRGQGDDSEFDSHLVVAAGETTRVFNLGEGIVDMTESLGSVLPGQVMCVGDVGSKKAMAVAHRRGVDLIVPQDDGLVKQDAWSVSDGETGGSGPDVVSACVCADQVLVVLSTGRLVLLRFLCREDACCLVRDASPSLGEALHPQGKEDVSAAHLSTSQGWGLDSADPQDSSSEECTPLVLILARENGALDIFEVSARRDVAAPPAGTDSLDMQTRINCLMSCQHASSLPDSILPSPPSSNPSPNGAALHAGSNAEAGHPQGASQRRISQIVAASFDVRQERPEGQTEGNPKACSVSDALVLFVTSDGSFDVYRVASLPDSSEIALHKARGTAASRASMSGPTMSPSQLRTCASVFRNFGDRSACGFFLSGTVPAWISVHRGSPAAHPLRPSQGGVSSGCSLHIADCVSGFVMAQEGRVIVGELPQGTSLEAGLARRTVKMRSTPTKITYYAPGRLYAVVTRGVPNEAAMYRPLQQLENTDPFAAASYVASTAAAGPVATEHLWMLKPGQWRPVCRLDVHVGEAFLCVHSLLLRQGASGTTEPVIALGLGMSHGEDFPAYGRAVFATLSRKDAPSVQEAALGMVWDIRTKFSTQFKGPVTAIQQVQDRVVIVAGGLILVSEWTEGGLEQQQQLHFDRQDTFVIGMRAAGAWLATVDFVRGTRLIQFHPEADEFKHKSVHAGRLTPHALEVLSTSGDTAATLALADAGGCLYMMEHRPDTDWKGEQIVVHSRIFLASVAEKLLLVPLPADLDVVLPGALLCCHLDGSVGVLLTVSAEASSAMRAATRAGMGRVATAAGLHPLAFRSSKGRGAGAPAGLSFEVGFSEPELAVDGDFLVELSKAPRAQRDAVLGALQADGDVAARAMGLVEECLRHFL